MENINIEGIIELVANKLNINKEPLLEIIKKKNLDINLTNNLIKEKIDIIKKLLVEDENINNFENKIETEDVKNNFRNLKESLGKLQILALIKKIEKSNNCDDVLNILIETLNQKISSVNNILLSNLKGGNITPKIDYYYKYLKYKKKYYNLKGGNYDFIYNFLNYLNIAAKYPEFNYLVDIISNELDRISGGFIDNENDIIELNTIINELYNLDTKLNEIYVNNEVKQYLQIYKELIKTQLIIVIFKLKNIKVRETITTTFTPIRRQVDPNNIYITNVNLCNVTKYPTRQEFILKYTEKMKDQTIKNKEYYNWKEYGEKIYDKLKNYSTNYPNNPDYIIFKKIENEIYFEKLGLIKERIFMEKEKYRPHMMLFNFRYYHKYYENNVIKILENQGYTRIDCRAIDKFNKEGRLRSILLYDTTIIDNIIFKDVNINTCEYKIKFKKDKNLIDFSIYSYYAYGQKGDTGIDGIEFYNKLLYDKAGKKEKYLLYIISSHEINKNENVAEPSILIDADPKLCMYASVTNIFSNFKTLTNNSDSIKLENLEKRTFDAFVYKTKIELNELKKII
jgi:hypothetical protein